MRSTERRTRACSPTAFGARDRGYFGVILCGAPWRRLMRNPLGRFLPLLNELRYAEFLQACNLEQIF